MSRLRERDRGPDPPMENQEAIGFFSNTGPNPLENHKATKPALNVGAIINPPAKLHLNGFLLVGK